MKFNLWEKIEWIREQPEHIRMRYVIGCLFVSMLFIFGIWLLSVGENFQSMSKDIPAATIKGKELLPKDQTTSLNDLLEKATPLQANPQSGKTDTNYLNQQLEQSSQNATRDAQNIQ